MGSWSGHTLPGSMFIVFGIVWTIKISYRYFFAGAPDILSNRRCSRFRWDIIENASLIITASFGLFIEQLLPWEPWFRLTESDSGEFNRANNWSHSTMYAFFIIYGISTILVMKLPKVMPHCLHHITLALAFGVEGYLFYFHTHGREELDVRVHVLLLYAIWPTSVLCIILCFLDNNENLANAYVVRLINMARMGDNYSNGAIHCTPLLQNDDAHEHDDGEASSPHEDDTETIPLNDKACNGWRVIPHERNHHEYSGGYEKQMSNHKKIFTIQLFISILTILHGTWFWQTAFVLYPPHGEPWNQESHNNIAFLTMFFTWYILLAMTVVGVIFTCFGIMSRRRQKALQSRHYIALQSERIP